MDLECEATAAAAAHPVRRRSQRRDDAECAAGNRSCVGGHPQPGFGQPRPSATYRARDAADGATTAEFQPLASFTVGKETSFQYTLTNAAGTSQPATVTIRIVATNPAPPIALPTGLPMQVSPPSLGGAFSAGLLESQLIPVSEAGGKGKGDVLQQVSAHSVAQLQLVPFVSLFQTNPPKLPIAGRVGDRFCV